MTVTGISCLCCWLCKELESTKHQPAATPKNGIVLIAVCTQRVQCVQSWFFLAKPCAAVKRAAHRLRSPGWKPSAYRPLAGDSGAASSTVTVSPDSGGRMLTASRWCGEPARRSCCAVWQKTNHQQFLKTEHNKKFTTEGSGREFRLTFVQESPGVWDETTRKIETGDSVLSRRRGGAEVEAGGRAASGAGGSRHQKAGPGSSRAPTLGPPSVEAPAAGGCPPPRGGSSPFLGIPAAARPVSSGGREAPQGCGGAWLSAQQFSKETSPNQQ